MKQNITRGLAALSAACLAVLLTGCNDLAPVESVSGVQMTTAQVQVGADGVTVEQANIKERIKRDNAPGSIKFLYVISPYTGDVIFTSTVKGKVTSSGKRLTPSDIQPVSTDGTSAVAQYVDINGRRFVTAQTPNDDGTFGDSISYLYWFDQKGMYHQQYVGGAIIHITDQPMTFSKTTQSVEHR